MDCQRNESEGRRAHGDEHRTKSEDGGVDKSLRQVFALFPVLFDGFEKHDDMADNHAHKTGDSQKCHEAEGLTTYRCVAVATDFVTSLCSVSITQFTMRSSGNKACVGIL
jgi:hypothetical protein